MLAVTFTLILALYVLGPDLVSRLLLEWSVPRRNVTLTKSEEVSRAVLWCICPLIIAVIWARWWGTVDRLWVWRDLDMFFSGVYSEQFFRENRAYWFFSARKVLWLNWALLWRLYVIVTCVSLLLNRIIRNYAKIRYSLREYPRLRAALGDFALPRVSPWHLLLSRLLLERDDLRIQMDVLTKAGGIMYQGRLADKTLAPDGTLISVTLDEPKRFKREEYLEHLKLGQVTNRADFWKPIPTNMFLIMASEIHTINLRYVPENIAALKRHGRSKDLEESIALLAKALEKIKGQVP